MDNSLFSKQRPDILAAIDQAKKKGPPGLAELAMLCLWLAGQHDKNDLDSMGPNGLKPLDWLLWVVEQVRDTNKPLPMSSTLYGVPESFPKPSSLRQYTESENEANKQVELVLLEAEEPTNQNRRFFLWCKGLSQLARSGIANEHLQPLIHLIIDNWSAEADSFGDAPKALLYAGELQHAQEILEKISISAFQGASTKSDCARILVEINHPGEARLLLEKLLAELDDYPKNPMGIRIQIARVYAYLGDSVMARKLIINAPFESCLHIECLIIWRCFLDSEALDLSIIRKMVSKTDQLTPPKYRASEQTEVLKSLLAVGAFEDAWRVLVLIQDTLLKIPLWGKLEHRTNYTANILHSYISEYPEPIFNFASGLLLSKTIDENNKRSIWPTVHVVSGVSILIKDFAGEEEFQRLIDFLHSWRDQNLLLP